MTQEFAPFPANRWREADRLYIWPSGGQAYGFYLDRVANLAFWDKHSHPKVPDQLLKGEWTNDVEKVIAKGVWEVKGCWKKAIPVQFY